MAPTVLLDPVMEAKSKIASRVTVVGLGRSGLAAARLLWHLGCKVTITESQDNESLRAETQALRALGIEVELGGHSQGCIKQAEWVVVSPGVAESSPPIIWALESGVPILSEIDLAFRVCPSPVIAVTGTNGKSSTVTLIAQLLKAAGRHAIACGNLGVPFSAVVDQLTPQSTAVVEVSSFQLLWSGLRPAIGVLLNIGTNHLDRHHNAQAYIAAKAKLFAHQQAPDWAVLNGRDSRVVGIADGCLAQRVWFGDNRDNSKAFWLAPETLKALNEGAQAVLQVGRILGIPDMFSWQTIRSFRGLEHRMEYAGTNERGIRFINDSKSTTPESTLFAMEQTVGELVLVIGGRDKGLDFQMLVERLHEPRIRGIVLIGELRSRLRPMLNGSTLVRESPTLEKAIEEATGLAQSGSTVLFSPACASFDMFRNFEDRGRSFKAAVLKTQHLAEEFLPVP
ncbi:MAG: UDP-N-acetylmuramoyl-L-alanine--D-glutamate ligase [Candidatus Omnitrophica bacterium]|nr:UDP-N-acetylmuramoyl-L-alanine--D-glutamate ligase [Candidatus Omnitrophota bacterium]MBI2174822.1 UDP-N-acetylmuramoyl-L-alanine--D-glutamate ligase [Candidatus Omnitrophota bacterium]MBI3010267.1 UDP-N-acetylmuramoyl-L-alanine--D-glutamate ligase [Candidatus Omnitrophota bacterium]